MNVLIIDDERSIRLSLRIALEEIAGRIFEAGSGEEGLELFNAERIDLAIVDIKLPGMDGIEVLKRLKMIDPNCTVIMITYLSEVKLAVNAMKKGAYDYFTKPFSVNDIVESIRNVMSYIEKKESVMAVYLQDEMRMVGSSKPMQQIKSYIRRLSGLDYDTCILIQGESGCGKEVVAQAIHQVKGNSLPFVDINCAAVPKSLQESELFGYEKGAFTEAKQKREGLIEKANGGILFLDEIGDMDLELQAKLLRVIQEKKFRRIGGRESIHYNATIIAATNKDLEVEIKSGGFRQDLYYRLNIIPIHIPPLRERKEDIHDLIDFFVTIYNEKMGRHIRIENENVYQVLMNYDWPGNVRELKNLIERMMILSTGDVLTIDHLPYEIAEFSSNSNELMMLENAEKEAILKALKKCRWNITHTANELGISRLTLRRKISKYELQDEKG